MTLFWLDHAPCFSSNKVIDQQCWYWLLQISFGSPESNLKRTATSGVVGGAVAQVPEADDADQVQRVRLVRLDRRLRVPRLRHLRAPQVPRGQYYNFLSSSSLRPVQFMSVY